MKLIYAIVRSEDDSRVIEELNKQGFSVTKLATTGGFLRSGNTTLIVGTQEDKVDSVMNIIRSECESRKQIVSAFSPGIGMNSSMQTATTIDTGGATVFVMDVERFEKI